MSARSFILGSAMLLALSPSIVEKTYGAAVPNSAVARTSTALIAQNMRAMPSPFTKNVGQWDDRVLFRTDAGGATIWFCRDGIYYQFNHRFPRGESADGELTCDLPRSDRFSQDHQQDSTETVVIRASFVQANPKVEIAGEDPLTYRCNYFLGNDPSRWRTNVPTYTGIVYRNVYPGIDAHFVSVAGDLRARWEVKSNADLSKVQFRYEGNAEVSVCESGELAIVAPWGTLIQPTLIARNGATHDLHRGAIEGESSLYSPRPSAAGGELVYSTYIGGGGNDEGFAITVDGDGSAYITGQTSSNDFPLMNPMQPSNAGGFHDVFVTKLSDSGTSLVYSTFIGGSASEYGAAITLGTEGRVLVTGLTSSADFPLMSPLQGAEAGGTDAFVFELNESGAALVYSTYLGGSDDDEGGGIKVDRSGRAYVIGRTYSKNFPVLNPVQSANAGGADVFVTKLDPSGATMLYSTFLGGTGDDLGDGIAIDGDDNIYLAGGTTSTDFPLKDPLQAMNAGGMDAFVTKLAESGTDVVYSTYLGGTQTHPDDYDYARSIAVDRLGGAYVTGVTTSADFPLRNPLQAAKAGYNDAFVAGLSESGTTLTYSTYLGGSSTEYGASIAVSGNEQVFVMGITYSSDFPCMSPFQGSYAGSGDVFVTKLSSSGAAMVYSTYLGGSRVDEGYGIAIDESGSAYVTGVTRSTDYPCVNPLQATHGGGYEDVFITKLAPDPCACECHADPANCDHLNDVLDVAQTINVAFGGQPALFDPSVSCPVEITDVDCSGDTGVADVVHMINVAFRGANAATEFCNPCP